MTVRRTTLLGTVVLAVLALAAGCSTVTVGYDYDTSYDFNAARTFDWMEVSAGREVSELAVRRVTDSVNATLEERGYRHVTEDDGPDLVLKLHASTQRRREVVTRSYGYGSSLRSYGGYYGSSYSDVYDYTEGTLVLDIIDRRRQQLVWRGTAEGVVDRTLSIEQRDRRLDDAVEKLLRNFPPPGTTRPAATS